MTKTRPEPSSPAALGDVIKLKRSEYEGLLLSLDTQDRVIARFQEVNNRLMEKVKERDALVPELPSE